MPTETKSRKGIGGPKTREGKERIRLNALKLGLYAQSIEGMQAVADVIGITFEEVHQKMLDYYQPADPLEEALVRRIARCTWKLTVIETMEDYLLRGLAVREAPGRSLDGLSVIERRTDVQLHRAIAALAHKRRQEQENEKNKLAGYLPPEEPAARPPSAPPADAPSDASEDRGSQNPDPSATSSSICPTAFAGAPKPWVLAAVRVTEHLSGWRNKSLTSPASWGNLG